MTKLYLIRHGEAVDAAPEVSDGSRWLTARGREETVTAAKHLRKHPPGAIVTSPLVRAVQTAEIVAERCPTEGPVTVLQALATGDLAAIERFIAGWKGEGRLALVGHEPTLSQLAVSLLKTTRWPGVEKSAVVTLQHKDGSWRFEGMFVPRTESTIDRLPD